MVLLFVQCANAQTWSEWFQQKKTQKQYLLQQIVALKIYEGYLSEGYNIAKNGLGIIQEIKGCDFSLHSDHFNSLNRINPAIQRYANVTAIIAVQVNIAKLATKAIPNFINSRQFTSKEIKYIQKVFESLLTDCATNMNELYSLITNDNIELKDDERIFAIDALYSDMHNMQIFTHSFCTSTTLLLMQRKHNADEITSSQKLNGLK